MNARTAVLSAGVAVLGACLGSAVTARAEEGMWLGLRGGHTLGEGPLIGAELAAALAPHVYFNPNVEEQFATYSNYTSVNADLHTDFAATASTVIWLGAGVGLVREDPKMDGEAAHTDFATNFMWAVGFRSGRVIPYLQGRVVRTDETNFSLAFGLRF